MAPYSRIQYSSALTYHKPYSYECGLLIKQDSRNAVKKMQTVVAQLCGADCKVPDVKKRLKCQQQCSNSELKSDNVVARCMPRN
jgi:hypothetical protein